MKKYAVNGVNATGTANKTAYNIIGSTAIRPMLAEVTIAGRTDPNTTDQQFEYGLGNTTAVGTAGSSPTPKPLDPQDVAAVCTAGITHSAEPTYGSTFFFDGDLNQRGAYRWVAEPGYEVCGAASANNGLGGKLIDVTATMQISMVAHYKE